VLRPAPGKLDGGYAFQWVKSPAFVKDMVSKATGASYPAVSDRIVLESKIPLPPLPEQRRIATILDQADALRTQRREALAQLESLTQSIFIEMFGDPMSNPLAWPLVVTGNLADVQGGLQVTTARKGLPLEVPYLRVANVYRGRLQLDEIKTIRATPAEVARTTLNHNDLLVVEGHGNPNEIGRSALWNGQIAGCIHQNHLIRVRLDKSKVVPAYACEYLNSPGGRQHLMRAGKTTSGLNTISVSNVREAPIAIPPLRLQQTFATRIQAVESLKTTHRAALTELDALFASLQHRAFAGTL
jgi:type I restriction enzyme S subunit